MFNLYGFRFHWFVANALPLNAATVNALQSTIIAGFVAI
jgi:hypothetical protein